MKTTKLAFSVYALTLALATNAAVAASGSANPSCTGNTFRVVYNYGNCSDTGGYLDGTAPTSSYSTTNWADTYTAPVANTVCLGYEQTGWTSDALKTDLIPGQTYTNDSNTWSEIPGTSSSYTINAKYTATVKDINLISTDADVNSVPTKIVRQGINLKYCTGANMTCTKVMLPGENGLTDYPSTGQIPVKYGYNFSGFFQNQTRADEVSANGLGSQYTAAHCADGKGFNEEEAAKGSSSGYVTGCPWIDSAGYVVNSNIGIAAAKLGTDELYAAFYPKTFDVTFEKGGLSTYGTGATKPHNGSISGIPDSAVRCTYKKGNCSLPTPTTSIDLYNFAGWNVKIYGPSGSLHKELSLSVDDIANYNLSEVITKEMWQANDNGNMSATFTALWTPDYATVKLFDSKDATTSFAELKVKLYNKPEYYLNDEKVTTLDIATLLADKMPANSQFRGLVIKLNGATDDDLAMVSVDSPALTSAKVDDTTKIFAITTAAGALNVDTAATTALGQALSGDNSTVNAYAVYAQECVASTEYQKNHVASCQLGITGYGAVSYAVTCESGYSLK